MKIVQGPPAAGKSTYVRKNATSNALIFDFDLIMSSLSNRNKYDNNKNLINYVDELRYEFPKIADENNVDEVWIITTDVNEGLEELKKKYSWEEVKLLTSKETCKQRIDDDDERKDKQHWHNQIDHYFDRKKNHEEK